MRIEDEGNFVRYICGKVFFGGFKNDGVVFCYVFVIVVFDFFDNGLGV